MALLSVDGLVVRFRTHEGTIHAVNGVSFDLDEGETLGIVGESGCGKSVTSLAIMRLLPKPAGRIEGGSVRFDGQDLLACSEAEMREMRGRDMAMIFQDPMTSLNPVLTIEEQMVETIQAHRKVGNEEARARAIELLTIVGIPEPENRLRAFPHQFSGGMRQRVMIAMALSCNPTLLVADEPSTALDVTIQAKILELMKGLQEKFRMSIIFITHNLGVIAEMADDVAVMYMGKIVEYTDVYSLYRDPLHPYTQGLLASIPSTAGSKKRLIPIKGMVPDPFNLPPGCPFEPRCPHAMDICRQKMPPLLPAKTGHHTACWLYDETGASAQATTAKPAS